MILVNAYGIVGLMLAPLATAAIQPMLESMLALRASAHPLPARDLEDVVTRLAALRARATEAVPDSQEVQSLVGRLEGLVASATQESTAE